MKTIDIFGFVTCECAPNQYLEQAFTMLGKMLSKYHTPERALSASTDKKYSIIATCQHKINALTCVNKSSSSQKFICVSDSNEEPEHLDGVIHLKTPFSIYDFMHTLLQLNAESADAHIDSGFLSTELVGISPAITKIKKLITQVANCDSNVLILGESGTGKEVVAASIHKLSARKKNPFVPLNCGAIPAELIESELFGHEKGAFTGALTKRPGRFEIANHGTLFLDEIGDMPLSMQVKLLRVLQERTIERVGSSVVIDVDTRIIAATNKNLEDMVANKTFREDLYYRLNVIPIHIPNLRDRTEDIPLLINNQLDKISKRIKNVSTFTDESVDLMCQYNWPGNIRELANFIERMVVISQSELVDASLVKDHLHKMRARNHTLPVTADMSSFNIKDYLSSIEQEIINLALEKSNGIVSSAAEYLNLKRTTLIEKIKKYKINDSIDVIT